MAHKGRKVTGMRQSVGALCAALRRRRGLGPGCGCGGGQHPGAAPALHRPCAEPDGRARRHAGQVSGLGLAGGPAAFRIGIGRQVLAFQLSRDRGLLLWACFWRGSKASPDHQALNCDDVCWLCCRGEECCACGAALRGIGRVCDGVGEVRRPVRAGGRGPALGSGRAGAGQKGKGMGSN